ncbi:hypothetical protein IQ06DRAFT_303816 [Phaeosphaeriaceae sp. SRC1lsM3a]|nr:hypothetical protein IQ06DRAFT_303816 [Stagonospora sp. SRC1lsM3a]
MGNVQLALLTVSPQAEHYIGLAFLLTVPMHVRRHLEMLQFFANLNFRIVVCIVDNYIAPETSSREDGKEREPSICEGVMTVQRLVTAQWAGYFTLVGPVPLETWLYPQSEQPLPAADGAETRWHLTSLFVLPEHRGRGPAGKLTLAALQAGSSPSLAQSDGPENHG